MPYLRLKVLDLILPLRNPGSAAILHLLPVGADNPCTFSQVTLK
jgi:hypothetical protein